MLPKVFYNDKCSVCRIEINHYKKICNEIEWKGLFKIKDINLETGRTPKQLVKKLHILVDNEVLVGVDAFIFIWSKIPKYKKLAKFVNFPIIYSFSKLMYEIIAFLLFLKNFSHVKKLTKFNNISVNHNLKNK